MLRLLSCFLGSALLFIPAYAALGSSPAECAARYGAGTAVKNGVPLNPPTIKTNTTLYKQGPFTIIVRFAKGKAVHLSAIKATRQGGMQGTQFTGGELQAFLRANLGTWETEQTSKSTALFTNKTRMGTYETHNHWLTFETKAYAEAEANDAKREMEELDDSQ